MNRTPAISLRRDLPCGLAACALCKRFCVDVAGDAQALLFPTDADRGVYIPDALTLSFFNQLLASHPAVFPCILLSRSIVESACSDRRVKQRQEIRRLCATQQPGQQIRVFEDAYHADIPPLVQSMHRALSVALARVPADQASAVAACTTTTVLAKQLAMALWYCAHTATWAAPPHLKLLTIASTPHATELVHMWALAALADASTAAEDASLAVAIRAATDRIHVTSVATVVRAALVNGSAPSPFALQEEAAACASHAFEAMQRWHAVGVDVAGTLDSLCTSLESIGVEVLGADAKAVPASARAIAAAAAVEWSGTAKEGDVFAPHVPAHAVPHLLRSGRLVDARTGEVTIVTRGTLHIVHARSPFVASVKLSNSMTLPGGVGGTVDSIPVAEPLHMNRAMHGDQVLVKVCVATSKAVPALPVHSVPLLLHRSSSARSYAGADTYEIGGGAPIDMAPLPSNASTPLVGFAAVPGSRLDADVDDALPATCQVIGILHRANTRVVATVVPPRTSTAVSSTLASSDATALAMPLDMKLPPVRVRFRDSIRRLVGYRLMVSIDDWPAHSKYPNGHYVSTVGPANDIDTEITCLAISHGITAFLRDFPSEAMAALPQLPPSNRWSVVWDRWHSVSSARAAAHWADAAQPITSATSAAQDVIRAVAAATPTSAQRVGARVHEEEADEAMFDGVAPPSSPSAYADRRDLRWTHPICSIDPPGCTDIDDALSARVLPNGNVEVGVHIADVSHFVQPGTALDDEARARGTTVYLVDRRYDMLPSVLSGNVCSLRARVDRFAMSVLWELQPVDRNAATGCPDFRVVPDKTWIGRTVIRSTHALTYDQAKELLAAHDDARVANEAHAHLPSTFVEAGCVDPLVHDMLPAAGHNAELAASLAQALDAAAFTPAAVRRRVRDCVLYASDDAAGGACGAPIVAADVADLHTRVSILSDVSKWLRARRRQQGGLEFDTAEMRFQLSSGVSISASVDDVETNATDPARSADDAGAEGTDMRVRAQRVSEPVGIMMKRQEHVHHMIAEFMIFSNETTAKLLFDRFPDTALLRIHDEAAAYRLTDLQALAHLMKLPWNVVSSDGDRPTPGAQRNQISALLELIAGNSGSGSDSRLSSSQAALLRAEALRCMMRAAYRPASAVPSQREAALSVLKLMPGGWGGVYAHNVLDVAPAGLGHFGLGLSLYTHFSSPIRRYADLTVHRMIEASLHSVSTVAARVHAFSDAGAELPQPSPYTSSVTVQALCDHLNAANAAAKAIAWDCNELFFHKLFEKRVSVECGVVKSVHGAHSATVYLERYACYVRIRLRFASGTESSVDGEAAATCLAIPPALLSSPDGATPALDASLPLPVARMVELLPAATTAALLTEGALPVLQPAAVATLRPMDEASSAVRAQSRTANDGGLSSALCIAAAGGGSRSLTLAPMMQVLVAITALPSASNAHVPTLLGVLLAPTPTALSLQQLSVIAAPPKKYATATVADAAVDEPASDNAGTSPSAGAGAAGAPVPRKAARRRRRKSWSPLTATSLTITSACVPREITACTLPRRELSAATLRARAMSHDGSRWVRGRARFGNYTPAAGYSARMACMRTAAEYGQGSGDGRFASEVASVTEMAAAASPYAAFEAAYGTAGRAAIVPAVEGDQATARWGGGAAAAAEDVRYVGFVDTTETERLARLHVVGVPAAGSVSAYATSSGPAGSASLLLSAHGNLADVTEAASRRIAQLQLEKRETRIQDRLRRNR